MVRNTLVSQKKWRLGNVNPTNTGVKSDPPQEIENMIYHTWEYANYCISVLLLYLFTIPIYTNIAELLDIKQKTAIQLINSIGLS